MTQVIKKLCGRHFDERWLLICTGLLLQAAATTLVIVVLHSTTAQPRSDIVDHIATSTLAGVFCLAGIIILLRLSDQTAANMAYGVFVCASLIFCLLNISTYRWSVVLMSLLSTVAYAFAATFVCLLAFPTGPHRGKLRIAPYTPLIIGLVLATTSLRILTIFPGMWLAPAFLTYIFPFVCMVTITWGIFSGLQRLSVSDQPIAGMSVMGVVFVLLSLAIVNGKSTPYHITYLPSTVGFLVFYIFFAASVALFAGIIAWGLQRLVLRSLRITLPLIIVCALLLLTLISARITIIDLTFIRVSLENLVAYHLFSLPLLILPIACCYALIHQQLSGRASLLSRKFIRGTLWFILASCFIVPEIIVSILVVHFWNAYGPITLAGIGWLFLSLWLFPLIWEKVRAIGDRMFYRDFYHYNRTLRDLSTALTRLHSLDQICAFILPRLTTLLNATDAALLVWDVQEDAPSVPHHRQSYQHVAAPPGVLQNRFMEFAKLARTHFTGQIQEPLLHDGILLLPLYEETALHGCLCLGPKLNREPYSRQDKSFLTTLAAQLAVLEASTRYLNQVHAHAQQLTALNHRIIEAQEEERRRLALELHDAVLQEAMLLVRQLADTDNDTRATAAIPLARSIVHNLRTTCLELRPPLLDELGLAEALRWLARQTEKRGNISVTMECTGDKTRRPSGEVELALYRVAQEALSNVLKHAEANMARIRLRYSASGAITLLIADDGHGLQRERPLTASLGLAGMAERMDAIHGSFQMRTGRGVIIRATYQPATDAHNIIAHEVAVS